MNESTFLSKIGRLTELLYKGTMSNELHWERVERFRYKHVVLNINCTVNEAYVSELNGRLIAIGNITRSIGSGSNNETAQNYFISFLDEDSRAVDSYFDFDFLSPFDEPILPNLLKNVRRKANDIDDYLNSLLD